MRQGRSYFYTAVFALPIFFALQHPQTAESIHTASIALMKPWIAAGQSAVSTSLEIRDRAIIFWKTYQQNLFAESEITRLQSELVRLKELEKENLRLKNLLAFRDSLTGPKTASRVIGWDPSLIRKMVILDKGKREKVDRDSAVIVSEGLVGRVIQASEDASRAILIIDPEARVSAVTMETRSQGVVSGNGTRKLQMHYLDLDSGVQVGEMVITSGVGELFPKGIRIGKITTVSKSVDGLHLAAEIEPFVRFSKLEEVICLGSSRQK